MLNTFRNKHYCTTGVEREYASKCLAFNFFPLLREFSQWNIAASVPGLRARSCNMLSINQICITKLSASPLGCPGARPFAYRTVRRSQESLQTGATAEPAVHTAQEMKLEWQKKKWECSPGRVKYAGTLQRLCRDYQAAVSRCRKTYRCPRQRCHRVDDSARRGPWEGSPHLPESPWTCRAILGLPGPLLMWEDFPSLIALQDRLTKGKWGLAPCPPDSRGSACFLAL